MLSTRFNIFQSLETVIIASAVATAFNIPSYEDQGNMSQNPSGTGLIEYITKDADSNEIKRTGTEFLPVMRWVVLNHYKRQKKVCCSHIGFVYESRRS